MTFPNEENGSSQESEETEQFFQKLGRMTDSPPLSEEFHERLRLRLKHLSSGAEESAQEYEIPPAQPSTTKVAANSKAGKRSIWSKAKSFSVPIVIAIPVIYFGSYLVILPDIIKSYIYYQEVKIPSMENDIASVVKKLQELDRKNEERYKAMIATINKFQDIVNDLQAKTSSKLDQIEALQALKEPSPEGTLGDPQQQNWPTLNDKVIISIKPNGERKIYHIDGDTLKILESEINEHYKQQLLKEKPKD